jgi:hypothetical protein
VIWEPPSPVDVREMQPLKVTSPEMALIWELSSSVDVSEVQP